MLGLKSADAELEVLRLMGRLLDHRESSIGQKTRCYQYAEFWLGYG